VLHKHAAWSILTGDNLSAAAAVEIGMINLVVPGDRLLDEAKALAAHISRFEPVALDWCKKALDQVPSHFSEWTSALEYGRGVTSIIREQVGKGSPAADA
jgi:enoyl-CoA hydratase/carnithine racemase